MKSRKINKVKYSPIFEEQLNELRAIVHEKDSKFHKQLLKAIEREKEYINTYGVTNLWKINLPDYWRMVYTIVGNELEIISILLEFMDHKEYNKKFGYRGN